MEGGLLAKGAVATANNDTLMYTVPSDRISTVNMNIVNVGSSSITVKIGFTTETNLEDGDYIEYNAAIPAGGVVERTGIACSPNEKMMINASSATVNYRIHGFNEVSA